MHKNNLRTISAWLVHLFTASGAIFGLLSLYAVHQKNMFLAFVYIAITIIIDAIDGTFARIVDVKRHSNIDGALLDNIIDFLTFVIVPCFMIMTTNIIHDQLKLYSVIIIILASCYQFTQPEAKTSDHFFKGFPSYWSIVVFYLYYWQTSYITNVTIITICGILTFVPIKYIYPSRLTYVSKSHIIRNLIFLLTLIWGAATLGLLFTYPNKMPILNMISIGYIIVYFLYSLFLTISPVKKVK